MEIFDDVRSDKTKFNDLHITVSDFNITIGDGARNFMAITKAENSHEHDYEIKLIDWTPFLNNNQGWKITDNGRHEVESDFVSPWTYISYWIDKKK